MNTQDDTTKPVVDAEIVSTVVPQDESEPEENPEDIGPAAEKPADDNAAQVLLDLEQLIKTNISNIDNGKNELKKLREMLTSALENDETYRLHNEEAKKAAKQKSATKTQIMQQTANKQLAEKTRGIAADVKEAEGALSDYLREYGRMSGTNEIETDDGQIREIVYVAKLVKKSGKFQ
jgi:Rad3-related DNA helicase